jgi:hypothetical protein
LEKKRTGDYRGFQLLEVREKIKIKITRFYIFGFFVCSQKYRRMLQDVYFIFGLQKDLVKSSKG